MRVCAERWVVSLGLDEFCSSKPRHAANNAVEEEKESERIPVCWHKVCSCFWKILHPAPVCMTRITRATELPVLTRLGFSTDTTLSDARFTLETLSSTDAWALLEMMGTEIDQSPLVQVKFHPQGENNKLYFS